MYQSNFKKQLSEAANKNEEGVKGHHGYFNEVTTLNTLGCWSLFYGQRADAIL